MPKISVIMPAYNAEKYIREAIDSILAQTYTDFEFIIIDDASTDATASIVESYTDERIRFFRNDNNMGVANTLNRGLDLAVGEYIARMDSDDISLPERFAKQVEFMDTHPDVAVCGSGIEIFGAMSGRRTFSESSEQLKVDLLFSSCFAHPSVIMRASVVGPNALHYDSAFSKMEDYDLWCRIAEEHKLASIPDILLKYRIHPAQVTKHPTVDNLIQNRALRLRILARLGIYKNTHDIGCYLNFCVGKRPAESSFILGLYKFFVTIKETNTKCNVYDTNCLTSTCHSIICGLLNKMPLKHALALTSKCNVNSISFVIMFFIKRILRK